MDNIATIHRKEICLKKNVDHLALFFQKSNICCLKSSYFTDSINRINKVALHLVIAVLFTISAFSSLAQAQNSVAPAGNAPGTPPGSYSLSDVETINLYSGKVNTVIPLLKVGGRGNAGYTMMLPVDNARWSVERETNQGYTSLYAMPEPHEYGIPTFRPFEFGTVKMRYTASSPGCPVPNPDGPLTCYREAAATMIFTSIDGTEHALYDELTGGYASQLQPPYNSFEWSPGIERGLVFSAKDESGWTFVSDPLPYGQTQYYAKVLITDYENSNSPGFLEEGVNGYLKRSDGTVVRFENSRAQWILDRNGNKTTFNYEPVAGGDIRLDYVTDSNNRVIDIVYGNGYQQLVYNGTNGKSRTITINYDSLQNRLRPNSNYSITTINGLFPAYPQFGSTSTFDNGNTIFNIGEVSKITLPDGRAYNFYYNPYGELARMVSPNGGAVEYEYGAGIEQNANDPTLPNGFLPSGQVGKITSYPDRGRVGIYRRLLERREYTDSNFTAALKTLYSSFDQTNGKVRAEQFDLLRNEFVERKDHFFNGIPYLGIIGGSSSTGIGDLLEGRESKTETFDVNTNSVMVREQREWEGGNCLGTRDSCEVAERIWSVVLKNATNSILDTSNNQYKIARKEFKHDKYDNLTDTFEYDFGDEQVGVFKRRSHTDYLISPNYVNANGVILRSLPSETWVSSDVNGNSKVSLTDFEYDIYSGANHAQLVSRDNVTGFDSTNFSPSYTKRGNLTAVTSYANVNGQNASDPVISYSHYDILGNVVETIDGNGNLSKISYDDHFGSPDGEARSNNTAGLPLNGLSTYAFPTSSTNAFSNTALNWTIGYSQFDYYTGQAVDAENLDGVVSTMFHDDLLDRPTKMITANNLSGFRQQTTTNYDDLNRKVTTTSDLFAFNDNLNKSETLYDGLGRTKETRKYEANGGYIAVQTNYDALSRPYQQSNPFRPSEINTANPIRWTESKFDSLGRVYETMTPDGAKVLTNYSGNAVTVIDQAGKQRRSITNALGQLKRVDEPNDAGQLGTVAAPNQPTSYDYDPLNNLKTVTQGVQTRSFVYDNLSRLLSATNPEMGNNINGTYVPGTVSYTYDNNGNLKTKRDARGIKTIYDYDELNRLKNRCYRTVGSGALGATTCATSTANGETIEPNTPDVNYDYDDASVPFSKGRLTKVTTGSAAAPLSVTAYTEFDNLGRIKQSRQTTDGVAYNPMAYTYYLSGALQTETYPSTRVVKNILDNTGDLSLVQSKKNSGAGFSDYAKLFNYTAAGAVSSMQLGNGKWESTVFNSRLQPTQIALGSVQNGTDQLKLNFSYNSPSSTTDNNGNIISQTITVPTETRGSVTYSAFTATQNYTYDSLNRLQSATEATAGQIGWQQNFKYDRYGNRQFNTAFNNSVSYNGAITALSNCQTNICNPTPDTTNNRLNGYAYDNAGNTMVDAENRTFTYDAENKQTEVIQNNVSMDKYYYDGDGKRVKKVAYEMGQPQTTIFIYDADGKMVAEYSTNPVSATDAKVSYLTNDHLGSPRITTDATGVAISRRDFMPFGEEVVRQSYGNDMVRQKFTGYERDSETDLDFAQSRYYNKNYGRFTVADEPFADQFQSNPQSWSLYAYARNNPLNLTDPFGMAAGCPPAYPECYEREGSYYIKDENGVESLVEDEPEIPQVETKTKFFATLLLPLAGAGASGGTIFTGGGATILEGGGIIAAAPEAIALVPGVLLGAGASLLHAYVSQGSPPLRDNSSTSMANVAIPAFAATQNCACSVPVVQMAKGGKQNIRNHWNDDAVREVGGDVSKQIAWLAEQYKNATDAAAKQAIKTAQKAIGGRKSSGGGVGGGSK